MGYPRMAMGNPRQPYAMSVRRSRRLLAEMVVFLILKFLRGHIRVFVAAGCTWFRSRPGCLIVTNRLVSDRFSQIPRPLDSALFFVGQKSRCGIQINERRYQSSEPDNHRQLQ